MKNIDKILAEIKKDDEFEMLKHDVYMCLKKLSQFKNQSMDRQGEIISKVARLLK